MPIQRIQNQLLQRSQLLTNVSIEHETVRRGREEASSSSASASSSLLRRLQEQPIASFGQKAINGKKE